LYSSNHSTAVKVGRIGEVLEGAHRPGHFEGVATVCAKLFNLVDPRRAFFGQKDAQQIAVIKRMVVDLDFGVEIVVCPTVRDGDGLALSSRNVYLSREQRRDAVALYRSLVAGRSVLAAGGGPDEAESRMGSRLAGSPGVEADYAVALDPDTFAAPSPGGPVLLAVAAHVGPARLIDNILWIPEPPEVGPGRGK
jgi:pantoate--beta-alanine ligase